MQRTERSDSPLAPSLGRACALLALAVAAGSAQARESRFGLNFGTKVWAAERSTLPKQGGNLEFKRQEAGYPRAVFAF